MRLGILKASGIDEKVHDPYPDTDTNADSDDCVKDLALLISGIPSVDVQEWKQNTKVSPYLSEEHRKLISWLWEVLTLILVLFDLSEA